MDIQCEFTSQQLDAPALSKIFCLDHSQPKHRVPMFRHNIVTVSMQATVQRFDRQAPINHTAGGYPSPAKVPVLLQSNLLPHLITGAPSELRVCLVSALKGERPKW